MSQHVLFEEDGTFKAGTVLSSTDAAHQVELASGKRTKVKAAHVLLQFAEPAPAVLLERAHAAAAGIDLDFLWEAAGTDEFDFRDLARDYYGHAPAAVEAASLLLRLHAAPVYFHRKGRGRYRPAPADILKTALAAVERKRRQEELRQSYVDELVAGRAPAAIAQQAIALAASPDRAGIEWKALEQAAGARQLTPLRLLLATGAIASPYRWHVDSFMRAHFPRGAGFAADLPEPTADETLPLAEGSAFSVDDSATTEIDDAFTVRDFGARLRIGIHIAAPATAIVRGHPLDTVARARMSTVYAPGLKVTMLPDSAVAAFSLNEGRVVPVLSLYLIVERDGWSIVDTETRLERLTIGHNLRHDVLDDVITEASIGDGRFDAPHAADLALLWHFARALRARREAVRGKPEPPARIDYSIDLDGDGEQARVAVRARRRGAPLDLIVAELAILANSHWGGLLADRRVAGIYRSQSMGRVKMSTTPGPHDALGVPQYAWSTSPLRRYVDLVNQRQLLAAVAGSAPPYPPSDAELFGVVSAFDAAYTAYAEFQDRMERYWSLRWLQQEALTRIDASVAKGDVLRLAGLPMLTRLPGLPDLPRGQQLELDVLGVDLIDLVLEARVRRVLEQRAADVADDEADDEPVELVDGELADAPVALAEPETPSIAGAVPEEPPVSTG